MRTSEEIQHKIRDTLESGYAQGHGAEILKDIVTELETHVWVRADHLFGVKELAALFFADQSESSRANRQYWGRTHISGWAARKADFPLPVARLGGPVWDVTDVVRWWLAWKPTPGKPSKSGRLSDEAIALYGPSGGVA